jgi:hypothetical protein
MHVDRATLAGSHRELAVIIYLNDVEEGGETLFPIQRTKVRPEAGKIVWFPAGFTHPHEGTTPVSGPKLIATSFLGYTKPPVETPVETPAPTSSQVEHQVASGAQRVSFKLPKDSPYLAAIQAAIRDKNGELASALLDAAGAVERMDDPLPPPMEIAEAADGLTAGKLRLSL